MRGCAGRNNWVDTTKVNVTLKGQVLESLHFVSITAAMFCSDKSAEIITIMTPLTENNNQVTTLKV
jgi:hypothetical protein